jgi:RND family efflux transporter MFP subunit
MNASTQTPETASVHAHAPTEEQREAVARRPSLVRLTAFAVLGVALFAALGVAGMRARSRQQTDRDQSAIATRSDKQRVLTTKAERAPAKVEQVLPGTASPLLETAVFARTSGYLKRWLVDIGDPVKEGQLLAEIETPEIDGQLLQARATLTQSEATKLRNKASAELARVNLARAQQIFDRGVGSRQDLDEADAALKVAAATVEVSEATIKANAANVKRLEDLQGFQKVTAPFAGVVTARNYDPGALLVADNATGKPMFHLAQIDRLRVFADIPQTFATTVRTGQSATVFRREALGPEFPGIVTRTTNAVDPKTRTLRVEVEVPNRDRKLVTGMFLMVRFQFDSPSNIVRIPGAAVITRAEGAKVAIVDSQGTVRYRVVKLGRDFGTTVEITEGLSGGETVVIRPGDDLADGTPVEPVVASDR